MAEITQKYTKITQWATCWCMGHCQPGLCRPPPAWASESLAQSLIEALAWLWPRAAQGLRWSLGYEGSAASAARAFVTVSKSPWLAVTLGLGLRPGPGRRPLWKLPSRRPFWGCRGQPLQRLFYMIERLRETQERKLEYHVEHSHVWSAIRVTREWSSAYSW